MSKEENDYIQPMLKNYFITAYRNLRRNKVYTALNVAGLALGIGCALVIYKVIDYESSFDKHHTNYDNIYRVIRITQRGGNNYLESAAPHPLARAMREDFSMIREVAMVDFNPRVQVNIELPNGVTDRYLDDTGVAFVQTEIFNILDIDWLVGNEQEVLKNPGEVVLSRSSVETYYGLTGNDVRLALGRTINLENKNDLVVVGVYEDFPETTDFPFKMMASYESQEGVSLYYQGGTAWNWVNSATNCLLVLEPGTNPLDLERQLPDFIDKHMGEDKSLSLSMRLQALSDIHFDAEIYNYNERSVNSKVLMALAIIGLVLVVTACINFINLSTAQAIKRSKEIGVRKVLGGHRGQLVVQFFSETLIITFFALMASFGIAEILMVNLDGILPYRLHLDLLQQPAFMLFIMFLALFVTILSGLYPALLLSSVRASRALKATTTTVSTGGFSLRRALVIFQFGISQLLIICTLVVVTQMDYFHSKDLGFNKDGIILTYLPDNKPNQLDRLKSGLLSHPEVETVSFSISAPTGENNFSANFNYIPINLEEDEDANFKLIDEDYVAMYDLQLLAGRSLTERDSNGIIINRQILQLMELKDPKEALGEKIRGGGVSGFDELTIVGVMEDFHSYSLQEKLEYVLMMRDPEFYFEAGVKFSDLGDVEAARKIVEAEWTKVFPTHVFDFDVYDDQIKELYSHEQSVAKLLSIFSIIAIFIGCLGLYGLITFMANQKTKEIGVRKVLGATITDILKIFSRELMMLLLIAFIVAAPIGFLSMNNWLSNFEYSIEIGFELFLLAAGLSLVIALSTMGYRSVKAACANPSESLKDE